ncbi:DEAD/DEAH box helicase [Faecalibaculum rodentium]|uniref:DEAD/DEAH box helicase n=1 Tax=Faecalibaculum rodentium TaxID=1702221 RepID=UPI0023F2BAEE|nr:DEAD/DEAH box helicase [Faecalibaculum rodentium]
MKLRPYQSEACRKIVQEFEQGTKRTLLILPTGCGKTVVFNGVAFRYAYRPDRTPSGGRVLILAHQNILIDQAQDKFQSVMGLETDRIKGRAKLKDLPIAVSSVQTMQNRLDRYPADFWDLIIIDEAHHSMSAGYRKVLDHFDCKVLGVTATPDRADGKKLETFDSIAFQYSIDEAIKDGYLAPIKVRQCPLSIDLSKVRKSKGDLLESDIGAVIYPHLHEIARTLHDIIKGRRTVCFVPLIRTAKKAAEIFDHYGFRALWTSGADPDREKKLAAFAAGRYDIIFNSMLLTEGWDCPETDCVIVLRPTTSRALYVQMVGRGLRLAPGKKDCLLVDFLFQNGKFDLASPSDVLGTNRKPGGGQAPWMEGQGGAPEDAETRLAKALEKASKHLLDPHEDDRWKAVCEKVISKDDGLFDPGPTAAQKRKLKELRLDPMAVTYTEASAILQAVEEDKEPSNAQKWRLSQLGFSSEEIAEMNHLAARKALNKAKAMGRW